MERYLIGEVDDFPEGRGIAVDVDGINVAVFNINGEFYGIQNMCPHKRYPIHPTGHETIKSRELSEFYGDNDSTGTTYPPTTGTKGKIDKEDLEVYCPWHHLGFDLESGKCDVTNQRIATYEIKKEDEKVFLIV